MLSNDYRIYDRNQPNSVIFPSDPFGLHPMPSFPFPYNAETGLFLGWVVEQSDESEGLSFYDYVLDKERPPLIPEYINNLKFLSIQNDPNPGLIGRIRTTEVQFEDPRFIHVNENYGIYFATENESGEGFNVPEISRHYYDMGIQAIVLNSFNIGQIRTEAILFDPGKIVKLITITDKITF